MTGGLPRFFFFFFSGVGSSDLMVGGRVGSVVGMRREGSGFEIGCATSLLAIGVVMAVLLLEERSFFSCRIIKSV